MLLRAIVGSLDTIINILIWLVLLRAIMSWFRPDPTTGGGDTYYRVLSVLHQLTEPLLAPIRSLMPGGGAGMGLDISPLILFLILQMLRQLIHGIA
ncbi:MAG: YggT family protein [Bacillota bacterium]